MLEKVNETIKKYKLIENGDKIILAVSGGPDSISMLDILYKIQQNEKIDFKIVVAHVNHMIRKEATDDANYVQKICKERNIEFYLKSIDVKKIANNNKIGTEEAGRIARYSYFDEIADKTNSNKIAIAHNKNDKVETMIMNELRGCGIQGLIGIEPIRGKYIRPLIECERKEIEAYCEENQLHPRIDKTNFENTYTRNKIRNVVIPYIQKEFNPNFIETMNRLSKLVTEQEAYIQKQVKTIYKEILIKENVKINQVKIDNLKLHTDKQTSEDNNKEFILLDLKKFNTQEKVIKSNILIYTITRLFGTAKGIEKIHIEDILTLCANNIGNKYLKPNKHIKVFVKNGQIKISKEI